MIKKTKSTRPKGRARFMRTGRGRLIILGLSILVLIGVVWAAHSRQNNPPTASTAATSAPTNPSDQTSTSPPANSTKAQTAPANNPAPTTTSSTALLAPTGDFVSSHSVSSDSLITSVCNTTPGAICEIQLSSGGTIKSLGAKTADTSGAVYWYGWKPQDYGLNSGNWTITAIASLSGQIKSAQDQQPLEVN